MPAPLRTEDDWSAFGVEHIARGCGRMTNEVIVRGSGTVMWSMGGKRFLDFTCGIGVTNLGHIAMSAPYLTLIERLLPAMPHPSLDTFYFLNSGSEAVEAAVRVARLVTGRQTIITMQGSYHGRTAGAAALTKSKNSYGEGVHPLMPGVITTPFPYWHMLGVSPSTPEAELCRMAEHQLDLVLRQQVHPHDAAAIIVEPVQGEGGYVSCPPRFLRHLRQICDKHGMLLLIDEIQTGFFRTGSYFAIEESGVRPDVLIIAKGMANGFPIAGIVGVKNAMDKMHTGSLGGTYSGNAVACAAAIAAQDVYSLPTLAQNIEARSKQMAHVLHGLATSPKTKHLIVEIRIRGLMNAVEFRSARDELTLEGLSDGERLKVPTDVGKRVQDKCLAQGLWLLTTSCFDTIRFIPPLNASEEEIAEGMDIFRRAVESVASEA